MQFLEENEKSQKIFEASLLGQETGLKKNEVTLEVNETRRDSREYVSRDRGRLSGVNETSLEKHEGKHVFFRGKRTRCKRN